MLHPTEDCYKFITALGAINILVTLAPYTSLRHQRQRSKLVDLEEYFEPEYDEEFDDDI